VAEHEPSRKSGEEKKQELFEQRAREREARLAAMRNTGQKRKEDAIKGKEELEKEAQERKQRSAFLRKAFSFVWIVCWFSFLKICSVVAYTGLLR